MILQQNNRHNCFWFLGAVLSSTTKDRVLIAANAIMMLGQRLVLIWGLVPAASLQISSRPRVSWQMLPLHGPCYTWPCPTSQAKPVARSIIQEVVHDLGQLQFISSENCAVSQAQLSLLSELFLYQTWSSYSIMAINITGFSFCSTLTIVDWHSM